VSLKYKGKIITTLTIRRSIQKYS